MAPNDNPSSTSSHDKQNTTPVILCEVDVAEEPDDGTRTFPSYALTAMPKLKSANNGPGGK